MPAQPLTWGTLHGACKQAACLLKGPQAPGCPRGRQDKAPAHIHEEPTLGAQGTWGQSRGETASRAAQSRTINTQGRVFYTEHKTTF